MEESQDKILQLVVHMYKVPLFFWFDLFLKARAEILEKISRIFWEIWRDQKDILKLTDLSI